MRADRSRLRDGINRFQESRASARVVFALKTAVAAAVAWYLAPFVPFADNDYSYYAPLGVLVSMYPTLAGSARAGGQALIGLALGIALGLGGLGLVIVGAPGVIAVATVIGLGILIGGARTLGTGGEWVAIGGLFVLLIGGPAAEEFSVTYLLTMAFGVVIGVATNFLVFPPLYLQRASSRLSALRDATATALSDLAAAMGDVQFEPETIRRSTKGLQAMMTAVVGEVSEAEESGKGNPRGRRQRGVRDLMALRMTAIERATRATIEFADTLLKANEDKDLPDVDTRRTLAAAARICGELVAAPTGDSSTVEKIDLATAQLDDAVADVNRRTGSETADYSTAYAYAALVCVRRIADACREFVAVRSDT